MTHLCYYDHICIYGQISRVRTGPGNPGKSLNLKNKNPGLESPGIVSKVLESPGILNCEKRDCKNSILLKTNKQVNIFGTS